MRQSRRRDSPAKRSALPRYRATAPRRSRTRRRCRRATDCPTSPEEDRACREPPRDRIASGVARQPPARRRAPSSRGSQHPPAPTKQERREQERLPESRRHEACTGVRFQRVPAIGSRQLSWRTGPAADGDGATTTGRFSMLRFALILGVLLCAVSLAAAQPPVGRWRSTNVRATGTVGPWTTKRSRPLSRRRWASAVPGVRWC